MNILIVADEESRKLWDYYRPGMLDKYELILSAGDLSPDYLQFLVTMSRAEVLYIRGNHDDKYEKRPPEGCVCVEDTVYEFKGIRILGLGGTLKYKEGKNTYTLRDMDRRIRRLRLKLHKAGGFDILLTHAPAYHLNDGEDLCHKGFPQFLGLMEKYRPKYMIHGHMHANYGSGFKRVDTYGETTVINGCGTYELEYPEEFVNRTGKKKKSTTHHLKVVGL